jgi:hypothetical protein
MDSSVGVNSISTLKVGQAYQIKMAVAHTIEYPANSGIATSIADKANSTHSPTKTASIPPWFYINTGVSHTIIIPNTVNPAIDGAPVVAGDYVGVFYDSSGTLACAGYEVWSGTSALAVSAFGDDPTTSAKDGLTAGEPFRWKIWRQSDSHAFVAIATYLSAGGLDGIVSDTSKYNTNGISAIATLAGRIASVNVTDIPTQYTLMQNYPNPFNPSTTITFGLPERGRVRLTMYNTLGEQVAELTNGELEAGYHTVRFDASMLPSGVYFYRIHVRPLDSAIGRDSKSGAGSFVQTRKLLLLR